MSRWLFRCGVSWFVPIFALLLLSGAPSRAEAQQGACCLIEGCIETTDAACLLRSGTFIGEGVPCDPDPCSPICSLEPSVLDFGPITVGSSRLLDFVVENVGYVRAAGSFSESCDGFQIISGSSYDLAPGQRKSFTVQFLPATPGAHECQITGTVCDGPVLLGMGTSEEPICLVTPTHLDFGALGVGQFRDRSITVRNVGDGLLVGNAAGCGPFEIVSEESWELGAGEEQTLVVRFRPSGEGSFSCTLSTAPDCEGVGMTGSGEPTPTCLVTPADLQFGEVILDTAADRTFTIENTGAGSLTGNVRINCPGFVLVGASGYSLDAGASQTFTVRFVPQTEGEAECEINLGTACGLLPALGTGVRAPLCAFSPAFLDFGSVPLGSSKVDTFRVTNFGGAELSGSFAFDCPDFEILGDPGYALGAGESRTFDVVFTPSVLGGQVCRLSGSGCADFLLRGFGVEGPECAVSTSEIDLGAVASGEVHRTSFRLANEGGAILAGTMMIVPADTTASLYRFAATGDQTLSYSLTAGQEFAVDLELVADVLGPAAAHVELDPGGAICPDVSLTAEVQDPPVCSVSADAWDFGTVPLGGSAEATVAVTNTGGARLVGTATLDCDGFSFAGGAARTGVAPAGPGGTTLPYDLGGGESLEIVLRFAPETEGDFVCEVDLGALCGSVALSGLGELAPACELDVTQLSFGLVDLGEFADRSFTIGNTGGGRLVGQATSPCPSFFFVGGGAYDLGPGESRQIVVRFVPDQSGDTSCVLEIGSGCTPLSVTATGNGPICGVSPSVLRFGTVLPGTSRDLSFVISNAGGGTLRGFASENCETFTVLGSGDYELHAGESAVINVRFAPRNFGNTSCDVVLSGGCAGVQLTGSGGEPPVCSIDTERLDFGSVALGAVVRESFRIQNLGEGRLRGRVTANCAGFRVLGERDYDLGAKESRDFEVELTAFEEGVLACELDLGSDCRQLDSIADVRLPLGACCFADGSCAVTGADGCVRSGGLEWSEEIGCPDAGCVPIGACCAVDGSCSLATEEHCFADAGVAWSEGEGCTTVECPAGGACCLLDGRCYVLIEDACTGDYGGDGTVCEPSPCVAYGACCFSDGSCELRTEARCTPEGGRSWTLGSDCDGVACEPFGACCLETQTCVVTTASGCNGEYLGDATVCLPGICLSTGACCQTEGECAIVRQDLCMGTFLGDGTVCAPGTCLPRVEDVRVVRNGADVEFEVTTPAGAVTELDGWYRDAGTFTYRQIEAFERRGDAWISRFDPQSSTVRGVEYYLSFLDEALGLRVFHGDPDLPHRLRIGGDEAVAWPPPGRFRMLAAPFEVEGAASVYELLESELGPTGARSWKIGSWDPLEEGYVLLDRTHPGAFESGRSYWVVLSTRPTELRLSGRTQFPPDRSYTFPIRLQSGWNMIGNPADYPIRTDPSRSFIADRGEVLTLADASSGESPRISPIYAYDSGSGGPTAPYRIAPLYLAIWEGGWIENRTGHAITLLLPAVDALADDPPEPLVAWLDGWGEILGDASAATSTGASDAALDFEQAIEVRSGEERRALILGTDAEALEGLDGWDLGDPPPAPASSGPRTSAAFLLSTTASRRLLRDIRPTGVGTTWALVLRSYEPLEVHFPDPLVRPGATPPDLQVRLRPDEAWRSLGSLRTWILPAGEHRMAIWARGAADGSEDPGPPEGGGDFSARGLSLRVEPHPVTRDATVLLTLPAPGAVRLECYDVRGARVWSYQSRGLAAGTHLVRWDGRGLDGRRVGTGTYFLQLSAAPGSVTRKIVLLPRD